MNIVIAIMVAITVPAAMAGVVVVAPIMIFAVAIPAVAPPAIPVGWWIPVVGVAIYAAVAGVEIYRNTTV